MVMALRSVVLVPFGVTAIFTPQGERHQDCVVQIPESATMKPMEGGIAIHYANGTIKHHEAPSHCHIDDVALQIAGAATPNAWIDEAGFTYNPGFSKMSGYNNIPDSPLRNPGTDYWFLGMQNMRGGPVSILQPVLTYEGSEWTAASWACCPSNITTTGPTIGPFQEGDRMYGAMTRVDADTWKIDTVINGQSSILNAQVGPWAYTWAVVTFEDYGVSSCSQLPHEAVKFDTIMLYDESGNVVHPEWDLSGRTMCSGSTTSPDENTVTIQHGSSDNMII